MEHDSPVETPTLFLYRKAEVRPSLADMDTGDPRKRQWLNGHKEAHVHNNIMQGGTRCCNREHNSKLQHFVEMELRGWQ